MNQRNTSLEQAVTAVQKATDSRGLRIVLCSNPMDPTAVRNALRGVCASSLDLGAMFFYHGGERAAMVNIALLANLLAEHLKSTELRENPMSAGG